MQQKKEPDQFNLIHPQGQEWASFSWHAIILLMATGGPSVTIHAGAASC